MLNVLEHRLTALLKVKVLILKSLVESFLMLFRGKILSDQKFPSHLRTEDVIFILLSWLKTLSFLLIYTACLMMAWYCFVGLDRRLTCPSRPLRPQTSSSVLTNRGRWLRWAGSFTPRSASSTGRRSGENTSEGLMKRPDYNWKIHYSERERKA